MSGKEYFEIHQPPSELLLPSAKKICPEKLNWPDRLAGSITERSRVNLKKNNSRPLFNITFKSKFTQKW